MTAAEKEKRQAKAQHLHVSPMGDDIHRDPSGDLIAGRWLVTCESDPAMRHQVRFEGAAASRWSCSCPDYRLHRGGEPSWTCKHIAAVQAQPKAAPAGSRPPAIGFVAPVLSQKERIELECQAMFGDHDAIAALNGKPARHAAYEPAPVIEVPRTPQPASVGAASAWPPLTAAALLAPDLQPEDSGWIDCCPGCGRSLPECVCPQEAPGELLDPCMECGQLLPAAEMLPLQDAEGSGLICRDCAREDLPSLNEIMETNAREHLARDLGKRKAAPAGPTLAGIYAALTRPFPIAQVEVKPGAMSNGKALALAYVDLRAYQARLDETAGPEGWSVEYRPLGERAVICRLTILGVTREDVGEADPAEENAATCMIAQAFKRACSAFGLGRYLYSLPRVWAEYDPQRKGLKDPEGAIQALYRGLKA